ncbi:MAG: ribonuclease J [bacterium]
MREEGRKQLRFMPLGGVDDINRNCYVVEYGNDILAIDLGLSFPDDAGYGIDYFIPDIDYLKKRKNQIAGIVLTHAHLDHIGAIPHVIEDLGFPTIYARQFTALLLKDKLREYELHNRVKIQVVEPNRDIQIRSFNVRWTPITHAIPQSCTILVKTPVGKVMYTGDFKFDDDPVNEPKPDYAEFTRIGKEGVDLLCMDSTNVFEEGKALSETEISRNLEGIIKRARARVFVATFSSLGTRLYSLTKIAQRLGKKITVIGRSMKSMLSILRKINYIDVKDDLFIDEKSMNKYPDEKLMALVTGTQGEDLSALARMSRNEHQSVKIKRGDTIILSSSVIPGNDIAVQHLIDDLLKLGARIFHKAFMDVHTSGHGYQEDMKRMYELIRPKNVMPVHGWPSFRDEMSYLLGKWGMDKSKILMASTGQQFVYSPKTGKWFLDTTYPVKDVYVDGTRVGILDPKELQERGKLAENGMLVAVIKVDTMFNIVGSPRILYQRQIEGEKISKIQKYLGGKYQMLKGKRNRIENKDLQKMEYKLSDQLYNFVRREIGKEPIIVVSIV